MLSPTLLEALRELLAWAEAQPTGWLFPGGPWHTANHPKTPRAVWYACQRIAYANAGVLDEAEREFRLVPPSDADRPLAQKFIRDLQVLRRPGQETN